VPLVAGTDADHTREYQIRPAALSDVGFLADVVVEATRAQGRWPADFDEVAFRRHYTSWTETQVRGEDAHSTTSVIELAGEAVGRLRIVRDGHRVELAGLQLRPVVQGRGIGTAIIEDLKSEAASAGVPLELSVEHDNPRARVLYERLGFVKIGEDAKEARLRWQPPTGRPSGIRACVTVDNLPGLESELLKLRQHL
jgi:ribosomal protein S18 acetylase RimI-like enzyme